MLVREAIDDYLLDCEVRRLSPRTIAGYKRRLRLFAQYCDLVGLQSIEDVTPSLIKKYTLFMVKERGYKSESTNSQLKSVKLMCQYCYEEELGAFDTRVHKIKYVKKESPIIRPFKPEDIKLMLATCKDRKSLYDVRDKALILTMLDSGLRSLEIVSLMPEDVTNSYILVRNAKGGKDRIVPVTPPMRKALNQWERMRANKFFKKETAPNYFLTHHGNAMKNCELNYMLKKRGKGIEGVRVSCHTFRHTWAIQQLRQGTSIFVISKLAGHSSVGVTQRYLEGIYDSDLTRMMSDKSVVESLLSLK